MKSDAKTTENKSWALGSVVSKATWSVKTTKTLTEYFAINRTRTEQLLNLVRDDLKGLSKAKGSKRKVIERKDRTHKI